MIKTQVAKPSPYSETWVDRLIPYAEKLPNRTYEALVELVNKHNMPDNMADDVIQGLWSRLTATASATQELPPEPGTAKIPAGHVRLYHQTDEKSAVSIGKHGLKLEHAKGIEGPKAIYADEKGFYGSPAENPTVEFHVPKAEWDPPFVLRDVTPKEILGVHLPWHAHARYIEDDATARERCLSGQFDKLGGDYTEAVKYIKAKYRGKTHATSDENRLDIPLPDGTVLFHFKWPPGVNALGSLLSEGIHCYLPAHELTSGDAYVVREIAGKLSKISVRVGLSGRPERIRTYTFPNKVCMYYLNAQQPPKDFANAARALGLSLKEVDVDADSIRNALHSNSPPQPQTVLSPRLSQIENDKVRQYKRARALWQKHHLSMSDDDREFLMSIGLQLQHKKALTPAQESRLLRLFKTYRIGENESAQVVLAHGYPHGMPLPPTKDVVFHFNLPVGARLPGGFMIPSSGHCYVPPHEVSFNYVAPVPATFQKLKALRITGYDWAKTPVQTYTFPNGIVIFWLDRSQYPEDMEQVLKKEGLKVVENDVSLEMVKRALEQLEAPISSNDSVRIEKLYRRTRALWKKANTRMSGAEKQATQKIGEILRDGHIPNAAQQEELNRLFVKFDIGKSESAKMEPRERLIAAVRTMAATSWTKFWPDVWYKATLLGPLGPFKDRDHVFVKANTEKPLQLGLTLWVFSPSDGRVMHVSKEIFDDTAYISKVKNDSGGWDMAHADKKQEARINQAWHPVVQKILNGWKKNDQVSHRLLKGNAIRTNTNAAQRLRELNRTGRSQK